MPAHIDIRLARRPDGRKTDVWTVHQKGADDLLGYVGWLGRWRCYAFFPRGDTAYERVCLRDLADFCEARTSEHRRAKALARGGGTR